MDTTKMDIRFTRHACKVAAKKGFTPEAIKDTFTTGAVRFADREGQYDISKGDMHLIGAPTGNTFMVITVAQR